MSFLTNTKLAENKRKMSNKFIKTIKIEEDYVEYK